MFPGTNKQRKEGTFGCSPAPKDGTKVHSDFLRYQRPERGHICQNRPFTKLPFCFLSIGFGLPREIGKKVVGKVGKMAPKLYLEPIFLLFGCFFLFPEGGRNLYFPFSFFVPISVLRPDIYYPVAGQRMLFFNFLYRLCKACRGAPIEFSPETVRGSRQCSEVSGEFFLFSFTL